MFNKNDDNIKVCLYAIAKNEVDEVIKDENIKTLLVQLAKTLREANYDPTASKGVFNNIVVEISGSGYDVNLSTRNGMSILLDDAKNYTTDKFLLGLQAYNILHQDSVVEGTVVVKYNSKLGKCAVSYDESL